MRLENAGRAGRELVLLIKEHPDFLGYLFFRLLGELKELSRVYIETIEAPTRVSSGVSSLERRDLLAAAKTVSTAQAYVHVRNMNKERLLVELATALSLASTRNGVDVRWLESEERMLYELQQARTFVDLRGALGAALLFSDLVFLPWRTKKGEGTLRPLAESDALVLSAEYSPYSISALDTFGVNGQTLVPLHTFSVDLVGQEDMQVGVSTPAFLRASRPCVGRYSVSLSYPRKVLSSVVKDGVGHFAELVYTGDINTLTTEQRVAVRATEGTYLIVGRRLDGYVLDPPLPSSSSVPTSDWQLEIQPLAGAVFIPEVTRRRYPVRPGLKVGGSITGVFLPGEVIKDAIGENEYIVAFVENGELYLLPTAGVLPQPATQYTGTESSATITVTSVTPLDGGAFVEAGSFFEFVSNAAGVFLWRSTDIHAGTATVQTDGTISLALTGSALGFLSHGVMPGDEVLVGDQSFVVQSVTSETAGTVAVSPSAPVAGEFVLRREVTDGLLDRDGYALAYRVLDVSGQMPDVYTDTPYKKRTVWSVSRLEGDEAAFSALGLSSLPLSDVAGPVDVETVAALFGSLGGVERSAAGKRLVLRSSTPIVLGSGGGHGVLGLPENKIVPLIGTRWAYSGAGSPVRGDRFVFSGGDVSVLDVLGTGELLLSSSVDAEKLSVTLISGINAAWLEAEQGLRDLLRAYSGVELIAQLSAFSASVQDNELFDEIIAAFEEAGYEGVWTAILYGDYYKIQNLDELSASPAGQLEELLRGLS